MKAWLMGHEFDLQYLADLLPSGSTRVTKEDGDFFLSSVELDDLLPGAYLHEVAGKLLTRANGLARVQNPGFQPVRLSGRYTDDERGHAVLGGSSIVIRAHIQASGSVLRSDGEARQPMVPFGRVAWLSPRLVRMWTRRWPSWARSTLSIGPICTRSSRSSAMTRGRVLSRDSGGRRAWRSTPSGHQLTALT